MSDVTFWAAEVVERSHETEVMIWTSPSSGDLDLPKFEQMAAWCRVKGDPPVAVSEGLLLVGLLLSEVTGRTDPLHGKSWWRGMATSWVKEIA